MKIKPIICVITFVTAMFAFGTASAYSYYQNIIEDKKSEARVQVESAYELMEFYAQKVRKGALSAEQAKSYALESIKFYTAPPDKYYWVLDTQSVSVMHPHRSESDGKDLSDFLTQDGKPIFKDMAEIAKTKKAGYVDYLWEKPTGEKDKLYHKVSYVMAYEPWGWVIGSGTYLDGAERTFWNALTVAGGLFLCIIIFTFSYGAAFIRRIYSF